MGKKQSGMTLVEVLAALVLSSLVILLIWTTISISMKYNIAETKKLRLQQEMNYVVTRIQQEHRYRDCYIISIKEKEISIGNCENNSPYQEVISSGFLYSPVKEETINTKSKDLDINDFIIRDPENEKLQMQVKMFISRYKTN